MSIKRGIEYEYSYFEKKDESNRQFLKLYKKRGRFTLDDIAETVEVLEGEGEFLIRKSVGKDLAYGYEDLPGDYVEVYFMEDLY